LIIDLAVYSVGITALPEAPVPTSNTVKWRVREDGKKE
jgi:hypothetical protein